MRLSEAIRLGALIRPQAFGSYFYDGRSCALGAAMEAANDVDGRLASMEDFYQRVSIPFGELRACPAKRCHWGQHGLNDQYGADNLVVHLNDYHRWTRERIADYIETLETARTTPVVVEAEAVLA
jgi:hypothetical protein